MLNPKQILEQETNEILKSDVDEPRPPMIPKEAK